MLIMLSMIGISSSIYSLLNQKINFQECFFQILRNLLNQNISNQGHLINRREEKIHYNHTLNIILLSWIIMSCILSLWFTSEMLTIYSTKRSIPLVQSLEDICKQKELQVAGMTSLTDLAVFNEELANTLKKHLYTKKDYPPKNEEMEKLDIHSEDYFGSIFKDVMKDVSKGRIVFLSDSDHINHAYKLTRSYYNLIIAKNKYLPSYYANFISRYYPYRAEIKVG